MRINVFDPTGNEYAVKGVSEFVVQHIPEMLEEPEIRADYASHTGLGRVQEQIHYLNSSSQPVNFSLYISDSYEGPPHSKLDNEGNVVRQSFNNLFEVSGWFSSLPTPPAQWRKAPYVRISLGRYSVFGVVTKSKTTWLRLQLNGEATLGRIEFTVKPDSLDFAQEVAFYEVT